MLEFLKAGGWVMWPIVLLSVLAMAIIIERFWTLRRKAVLPQGLGAEVCEWAATRQLNPAHIEVLRHNSPLGELLAAGLDVRHRPREQIKERIEDVGRHVVHRMERYLNTLGTIAGISPFLGLLGTVFGMIRMFMDILEKGVGDAGQLAGGIGQALISTAGGLCLAIPALMFYRHLRGLIAAYVIEMEQQAMALLDTLDAQTFVAPAPAAMVAPASAAEPAIKAKPAPRTRRSAG